MARVAEAAVFSASPVVNATLHWGGKQVSVSSAVSAVSLGDGVARILGEGPVPTASIVELVLPAETLGTSTNSDPISRRRLCPEVERMELPSGPPPTFSWTPLMPETSPGRTLLGPR